MIFSKKSKIIETKNTKNKFLDLCHKLAEVFVIFAPVTFKTSERWQGKVI